MDFSRHAPEAPPGRWIKEVFHYRNFVPAHRIERLVPTGYISLLFALDGAARHTYDPAHLTVNGTYRDVWIYGMHRHHLSISAHHDSEMLVIRFTSPGALPFLHEPLTRFSDRLTEGQDALGGSLLTLCERLKATPQRREKFELVDAWLRLRYRPDLEPPVALVEAVESLRREPGQRLAEVARRYPRSQKDLIAQFRLHLGVTPKAFQRLLRFSEVLSQIEQQGGVDWAATALECGYTDQSHFIREFRHFSGFTPQRFADAGYDLEYLNYFPLDDSG